MGLLFASLLSRSGEEVTLIGRRHARDATVRVTLEQANGSFEQFQLPYLSSESLSILHTAGSSNGDNVLGSEPINRLLVCTKVWQRGSRRCTADSPRTALSQNETSTSSLYEE